MGAAADDEATFERLADELYGVRPDEFAAARDAHIKEARAAKQPALAKSLAALRRPTQSAWLINLLWRDQRDVLEGLLDVGAALGEAQAQASGPDLQRLMQQRRQLEAALLQRARELARAAGVSVSEAMTREAQETLGAALADPDVAAEIRRGRLTRAAAYAGFGVLRASSPAGTKGKAAGRESTPAASPGRTDASADADIAVAGSATASTARSPAPDPAELEAARRARERRRAAEAEVTAAREAVAQAARDERSAAQASREASHQHKELEADRERLRTELDALDARVAHAAQQAESTTRASDRAAQTHTQAQTRLETAEAELRDATRHTPADRP